MYFGRVKVYDDVMHDVIFASRTPRFKHDVCAGLHQATLNLSLISLPSCNRLVGFSFTVKCLHFLVAHPCLSNKHI